MNLHYAAWTVAIALLSLQACSSLAPDAVTYEIGPGPEDLVLTETSDGALLVTATAPRGVFLGAFLSKLGAQQDPRFCRKLFSSGS